MQTVQSDVHLRTEVPEDAAAIRAVIGDAFREHPHSRQTEASVVDAEADRHRDGSHNTEKGHPALP